MSCLTAAGKHTHTYGRPSELQDNPTASSRDKHVNGQHNKCSVEFHSAPMPRLLCNSRLQATKSGDCGLSYVLGLPRKCSDCVYVSTGGECVCVSSDKLFAQLSSQNKIIEATCWPAIVLIGVIFDQRVGLNFIELGTNMRHSIRC